MFITEPMGLRYPGTNWAPTSRRAIPSELSGTSGIGVHLGPVLSPFLGSVMGGAFGHPTMGWAVGTGMGFAESGLYENLKSHWDLGLGKGKPLGFGGTALLGSTAASMLGAGPGMSMITGLGFASGAGAYDWFGRAPGLAAGHMLMAAAFSPIGTLGAAAFAASDFSPTRFAENVIPNVLPGAAMVGGALGGLKLAMGNQFPLGKALGGLAGNKWGRLGMLGAAVAASQSPSLTNTVLGFGAAGAFMYAGGAAGAKTAGMGMAKTAGSMASAFFKHPYRIGMLAGGIIGAISGLTGMTSRGAEDELINDQFGTFTMRQAGLSGMGSNYLDAAGVSLAAHYNSRSFSRG